MSVDERAFEDAICDALVDRCRYAAIKRGNASGDFDVALGLDTVEVFAFVRQTQPEAWQRLVTLRGGEQAARLAFAARLAQQIDARGTICCAPVWSTWVCRSSSRTSAPRTGGRQRWLSGMRRTG